MVYRRISGDGRQPRKSPPEPPCHVSLVVPHRCLLLRPREGARDSRKRRRESSLDRVWISNSFPGRFLVLTRGYLTATAEKMAKGGAEEQFQCKGEQEKDAPREGPTNHHHLFQVLAR